MTRMSNTPPKVGLARNTANYGDRDFALYLRRSFAKSMGYSQTMLDKPVVGIVDTGSDYNNCHRTVPELIEAVKRGVLAGGALPLAFPTVSLCEPSLSPTSMHYRNLAAIDTEAMLTAQPMDAAVLIGGCDKTVPAQIMAAVSADLPAIMVTGGPSQPAWFRGRQLGAGTDLWHYLAELRAGRMTQEEFDELEAAATPSFGHCNEMGTASTMTSIIEALGMALPGTASIPAVEAGRGRAAEETGIRAVALAREGLRPSQIVTEKSLDNAITLLMALGGGTNAVIQIGRAHV